MHTFLNLLEIFLVAYEIIISHCEQNIWYSCPILLTLLHVCPFVNTVKSHLRFVFGSSGPEHDSKDNLNGENLTSRNFKWENKIKENWMYAILALCFLLYSEVCTAIFNAIGQNNPLLYLSIIPHFQSKQQSHQCKSPKSLRPKKARQVHASIKTMLISSFFYVDGIVHREFVPPGQTVNQ